jgi:hypothetical protein
VVGLSQRRLWQSHHAALGGSGDVHGPAVVAAAARRARTVGARGVREG